MNIFKFGRQLIEANDLDPLYVLLYNSELEGLKLKKFLLAYFCFYHCGTASWIVDQPNYWEAMEKAAGSKEFKRNKERRHFRGGNAANSITYLRRFKVRELFKPLTSHRISSLTGMRSVERWVGFGPWISFKVVDMLERLELAEIEFSIESVKIYGGSPKRGALLLRDRIAKRIEDSEAVEWALEKLVHRFEDYLAPPNYNRSIGIQEAETILCKWKSGESGHYKLGEDVKGLLTDLEEYNTDTTKQLKRTYNRLLKKGELCLV